MLADLLCQRLWSYGTMALYKCIIIIIYYYYYRIYYYEQEQWTTAGSCEKQTLYCLLVSALLLGTIFLLYFPCPCSDDEYSRFVEKQMFVIC